MFNIITFGSATQDIFLELEGQVELTGWSALAMPKPLLTGELCFPLGGKIIVDEVHLFSGGGGANTACSFAKLGLKTAYCGKIGNDAAGAEVANDLRKFKVSRKFLIKDKNRPTALSIILSSDWQRDRAILVYKGACHFLAQEEIPMAAIKKTKWFYIAPLYEQSMGLLRPLVDFAKRNKIKAAINPSQEQIVKGGLDFETATAAADVLLMNLEEAKIFTKADTGDEMAIMEKAKNLCSGIVVITKGKEGALIGSRDGVWQAGIAPAKFREATGAGDAFASGFVAGIFLQNKIDYGIILGMANSAGCVSQMGAKNGLLIKSDLANLPQVAIKKN